MKKIIDNRKTRLAKNTLSPLVYQIVVVICGFIIPRLIIGTFGSETNGLVNSIQQFLGIISFLELGVGAVVESSLYKPLAEKNNKLISQIYKSASKFFHTIGLILFFYVAFLIIFYPRFANQNFGYAYTALLIVSISISYFAQYYFGIVNQLLLNADQRGYIQYTTQTIAVILNTVACFVLIKLGSTIHMVKLTTSVIYLCRPLVLYIYVKKHYSIDRKVKYDVEPIKQKWNGIAQHVSMVVLNDTDVLVLTIFSTLTNVSIYYVYNMVISGIKQLFDAMTVGILSLLGELWALNDKERLRSTFDWTEWLFHTATILVFGCTGVLIVPFVKVYTRGISDANYIVPLFATCLTIANAGHCLRLPYHLMIKAAGHYKQTQNNYIIAALLNISISVLMVRRLGLVGVAIGTMIAMFYQTIWMAFYNAKHILKRKNVIFFKHIMVDLITATISVILTANIPLLNITYTAWILLALEVLCSWTLVTIVINFIFYPDKIKGLFHRIGLKAFK